MELGTLSCWLNNLFLKKIELNLEMKKSIGEYIFSWLTNMKSVDCHNLFHFGHQFVY